MSAAPATIAGVWAAISLAVVAFSVGCALLRPLLLARRTYRGRAEPVSVVIPVKLLDPGFLEAQRSVLREMRPGDEIIVSAREGASPALDAARAVFADAPARLLRSTATFAASPKVDNLVEAIEAASHDLIFMKDSNVELPPGAIRQACLTLADDVGLVCAIPRAGDARNFAARVEAQIMNQSHGRLLLMGDALGLGFGVGKIMVFRRSALARIGGLAAVGHSVGEDSALANALARIGLRTRFMPQNVFQRLGARRWRDVWARQMRWTAVRAHNTPLPYALEPVGLCIVAALAAGLAAPLLGLPFVAGVVLCLLLWFALETLLALHEGWDVSLSAPAVMVARDAMMLAVWVCAPFVRRVTWAGAAMPVQADGRLLAPGEKGKI